MISVLFKELRVYQWTKNLLVFGALIFARQLGEPLQIARSVVCFCAFCAASSLVYVFNDIMDVENDRVHPEKCKRPLASGAMSMGAAKAVMALLMVVALVVSSFLGPRVLVAVTIYVGITLLYSLGLKNVVIIDVMIVAIGFVVRAMAGAVALDVTFSNWLVVCTLFLALFLGISKRRHEIQSLEDLATSHREVLGHYSVPYLDSMTIIVGGATLITYTIYTCSPDVVERMQTDKLYLTLPLVVYGLFRYLYLVQRKLDGGDPSSTLLRDKPLAATVLLWVISCAAIIYWPSGT